MLPVFKLAKPQPLASTCCCALGPPKPGARPGAPAGGGVAIAPGADAPGGVPAGGAAPGATPPGAAPPGAPRPRAPPLAGGGGVTAFGRWGGPADPGGGAVGAPGAAPGAPGPRPPPRPKPPPNTIITGTGPVTLAGVVKVNPIFTAIIGYEELSTVPTSCLVMTGISPTVALVVLATSHFTPGTFWGTRP